jgi:hypothetical protein
VVCPSFFLSSLSSLFSSSCSTFLETASSLLLCFFNGRVGTSTRGDFQRVLRQAPHWISQISPLTCKRTRRSGRRGRGPPRTTEPEKGSKKKKKKKKKKKDNKIFRAYCFRFSRFRRYNELYIRFEVPQFLHFDFELSRSAQCSLVTVLLVKYFRRYLFPDSAAEGRAWVFLLLKNLAESSMINRGERERERERERVS